jgi:hypothetical protein
VRNKNKESKFVLLASILAIFIPVFIAWYRGLPIPPPRAESASKLGNQWFGNERARIEAELGQRDSRLVTESESEARWAILEGSMIEEGATKAEVKSVLREARTFCNADNKGNLLPHWPIFIQRGYVGEKTVWISVVASQSITPQNPEIVTGWDYFLRVTDPQDPSVNDLNSSGSIFPRCYGPNTPFPIQW